MAVGEGFMSVRELIGSVMVLSGAASPAPSRAVDVGREALAEARAACTADAGRLWGVSLCTPLLIVEPASRRVVASQSPAEGRLAPLGDVFVGVLPKEMNVSNTAATWGGTTYAMVRSTSLSAADPHDRARLLMHESWHAVQERLGFPAASPTPAHLGTADGRAAMRLEWRALARALTDQSAQGRQDAAAALVFRAWRRSLFPEAAALENQLELNEGLAEYTGYKLSGRAALDAHVAAGLRAREKGESYVRSFAYGSGPAYGLLLDRYDPAWREKIRDRGDLGELLKVALAAASPVDLGKAASQAGGAYGMEAILAEERTVQAARDRTALDWRRKLVSGPGLRLPLIKNSLSFNPNNLFPLPPEGTVYPTLRAVDAWGVLEVEGGALVAADWSSVTLPGPVLRQPKGLTGPGWSLQLADEWTATLTGEAATVQKRSGTAPLRLTTGAGS